MTHDICVHSAWHMAGVCIVSLSVDLRYEVVNYTPCSTPHTIALLLLALKAQHGHILALFLGPAQFFVSCRVWSCDIKMSAILIVTSHVAALVLQTLKGPRSCS